jgi:hypothetical protein
MTASDLLPVSGPLAPLAWTPSEPVDRDGLADALGRLARRRAAQGLQALQERIYVEAEHATEVLALRAEALEAAGIDPDSPVTIVANRPCVGGLCGGIHLLAWEASGQGRVTAPSPRSRMLDLGRSRALFVSDLRPEQGAEAPIESMFEAATAALAERGMTFRHAARTWLYLAELLPRYAALNAARDVLFEAQGLGAPGALVDPPASTGIQGLHPSGAACFMDLLAVRDLSGRPAFQPVEPELQCEAWAYGSAFSRGVRVPLGASTLVSISGTASIGTDGATLHVDEPAGQLQQTLRSVESLLARCDLPPRMPGLWTLYFKDERTWRSWRGMVERGEVEDIEGAAVFADVCRDELLFEVELTTAG